MCNFICGTCSYLLFMLFKISSFSVVVVLMWGLEDLFDFGQKLNDRSFRAEVPQPKRLFPFLIATYSISKTDGSTCRMSWKPEEYNVRNCCALLLRDRCWFLSLLFSCGLLFFCFVFCFVVWGGRGGGREELLLRKCSRARPELTFAEFLGSPVTWLVFLCQEKYKLFFFLISSHESWWSGFCVLWYWRKM